MTATDRMAVLEQLPIRKAVCRQIFPAIAAQMVALLYSLADTYFVGLLGAPAQTAAVTVAYPPFLMLTALSNLFGVGGAGLIARRLGKRDTQAAGEIAAVSFWYGLGCAGLASCLFFVLARPILTLCGAQPQVLPYAHAYAMWVIVLGGVPTVLNVLLANLVRAEGAAAQASLGVSLGGFCNLLLDPLLILPQFAGLGVVGAGVATALSNLLATLYFLWYLLGKRHGSLLRLSPVHLRQSGKYLREILATGFPSALQYALTVAAVGAQSAFVSRYATEATAALGITKKLDQLPLYFSIGLSNGLLPLLAYTQGAGDPVRRRAAFRFGAGISLGFSLLCLGVFECFAPRLVSVFLADAETIAYGAAFLRRMVVAMPFMAVCYPLIIQFQAIGRAREALIVSLLRKGVLDVPLLFCMDRLLPLYGCMWVQPIVDGVSLAVGLWLYDRLQKRALA